jgi:hypothetical protein
LRQYVSTEQYHDLDRRYNGAIEKIKFLEEDLIRWKGGKFPIEYIIKMYEEITILDDLPVKLQSLSSSGENFEYADISSPVLGSSSARFYENTATSFMHKKAIYNMKIKPIEFRIILILIDRTQ